MGKEPVIRKQNSGGTPPGTPMKLMQEATTAKPARQEQSSKPEPAAVATSEAHPPVLSAAEDKWPAAYGENRVVVMPVTPDRVHSYWEIDHAALKKGQSTATGDQPRWRIILRVQHAAASGPAGPSSSDVFDVEVAPAAKKCYISLPEPEQSVVVELGVQTEDGRFLPLAKSNRVTTPALLPAAETSEPQPHVTATESLAQPPQPIGDVTEFSEQQFVLGLSSSTGESSPGPPSSDDG